jgi:tRNA(Ile)-lysidine synthase
LRGTGIRGLAGIGPKNGCVVRPLLGVSKQEIMRYAAGEKLPFVVDSSNLQDEYLRNKIRLSALPLLQTIRPAVDSALIRTMENVTEAVKIYDHHIREAIERVFDREKGRIDVRQLKTLPSPEAVLFELLKEYGFGRSAVRDIFLAMDKHSGREFYSQDYFLLKDRDYFLLQELPPDRFPSSNYLLVNMPESDVIFVPVDEHFTLIKDRRIAYFDAEKLQFPLQIRHWRQGDRFMPLGMNRFQKLSDYFSTHKFSKTEKEKVRLLCSGDDIIWIMEHRIDHRYRITESTQKAAVVKLF